MSPGGLVIAIESLAGLLSPLGRLLERLPFSRARTRFDDARRRLDARRS